MTVAAIQDEFNRRENMYDKTFSQNRRVQGGKTRTFSLLCCFVIIVSAFVTFERGSIAQDEASHGSVSLAEGSASIGLNEDVERSIDNSPNLNPNGVFGEQLAGNYPSEEGTGGQFQSNSFERNSAGQETQSEGTAESFLKQGPQSWFSPDNGWFGRSGITASLKTLLIMSALSLAPALLLMTTSYIRISVVLMLLRQALGAGQVPSNQVIATLAIFLTFLIMAPVWTDVYKEAVEPYSLGEISNVDALDRGQAPIRTFLWKQIERSGNSEMINVFIKYIPDAESPQYYEDVPWRALAPAFVLSELKTAFLIGFQIFLPFLIIDLVVSSVLVSSGMMMLPPAIVSLPFKLALFVLVDGWTLIVKSLLESFAWGTGA